MTNEGREYERRGREGSDEDIDRAIRETIDEMREEIENKREPESGEFHEQPYCPDEAVREAIKEIQEEEAERLRTKEQKESDEEPEESKEQREVPEDWDVERCVREAVNEVQEEEIERQQLREEREHAEMEKEQQLEASYEERKESAEKDNLDEDEERIAEGYGEYGIDSERVKERWRERFEEEVRESTGERSGDEKKEEDSGETSRSERTAEGSYYYDDGSGQVYEIRMDSPEGSSTEVETSSEVEEKTESSQPEMQEGSEVKKESDGTESKEQGPLPVEEVGVRELPPEQEESERKKVETRTESSEVQEEFRETSEHREDRKQHSEVEDQRAPEKTREPSETIPPQEVESETREVSEKRVEQSTIDEYANENFETEGQKEQKSTEESSVSEEHQDEEPVEIPEDFERSIEELLEDLISELESEQEKEEADEPRVIVDAMTGSKHVDHTYEVRPYFEDAEEETEEHEEVNLRERFERLFGELSEEEREKFKEKNRPRLETEEDLDELIERNPANRASPDFEEKYEEAKEYIRSGKKGEVPKLIKELMRDEVERAWSEFVFGKLGEALTRRLNSEEQTKEHRLKESSKSKVYPIKIWTPELDGIRIRSYDQLVEVLRSRSPAFFKRKDADKLLKSAKLHIELYQEYGHRTHLEQGEVAALAKKLKQSPVTIKRYLREGVMPKIYYWNNKVPSIEREEKLKALLARLNGVTTEEEYERRFSTLYFSDEMSTTADHKQKDEFTRKFFKFIREYGESGLLVDLTKRLRIGKSTIVAWFDGTQLPTRIAYATLIPEKAPRSGWRWLPKKLNHITNLPEDFIQVPTEITSPQDLLDVLNQLFFLDTKAMRDFEKEHGEVPQDIAFMHLLGLMVSDGGFKSEVDYSAKAELFVSKKYPWGSTLGKGFCYSLGRIGLSAKRDTDQEKVRENGKIIVFRKYSSEASPVLMWMKKALLGLDASEVKKEIAIKAEWILNMPHEWKIAFIQGLADGDGYASISRFDTAITTTTNDEFFEKLLSSIGIESTAGDNRVRIKKYNEILKAKELPLFKYATGRQQILDDMCKIIKLKPKGRRHVPEEERELIMELHRSGLKPGEILEKLWRENGWARTIAMVEKLIRRENKKITNSK